MVQSLYSIAHGGFGGTGLGPASSRRAGAAAHPVPQHRLHLLRARAGARPHRRGRAAADLHGLRPARLPGRRSPPSDGFSKLLAPGSPSASRCRRSSSSAGSSASSRSPGSRCRSSRYGGSSIVANFLVVAGPDARLPPREHGGRSDEQAARHASRSSPSSCSSRSSSRRRTGRHGPPAASPRGRTTRSSSWRSSRSRAGSSSPPTARRCSPRTVAVQGATGRRSTSAAIRRTGSRRRRSATRRRRSRRRGSRSRSTTT